MKQTFTQVRLWFVALCCMGIFSPLFAQFSGSGSGTKSDPYRIFNAIQLNQVRNFLNKTGVYFSLEADIDMTEWIEENNPVQGWSPIGTSTSPFKGIFNGNGHTISNLWIDRPNSNYIGLFGYVGDGANISGLTLRNADYKGKNYVGGIVGYGAISTDDATITIQQCALKSSRLSGTSALGGIMGSCSASGDEYGFVSNAIYIRNCLSECKVEGSNNVGGVLGEAYGYMAGHITLLNCVSMCQIMGDNLSAAGGVVGSVILDRAYVYRGSGIQYCYAACDISGSSSIGGIIGQVDFEEYNGTFYLDDCYVTGMIEGRDSNVAGLMGTSFNEDVNIYASYAQCRHIAGGTNVSGIGNKNVNVTNSAAINELISSGSNLKRISDNGSASGNLAWTLTTMVLNGKKQPTPLDDAQNGTSTGLSTLKLQATYEGLGWDFTDVWDIQETESFPYFQYQTAPPHFTQTLKAGDTQLSGQCAEGGTVTVRVGDKTYTTASNGNTWSLAVDALKGGDLVEVSVQAEGKMPSYVVYATVSLAGSGTEEEPYLVSSASDLQAITDMETEDVYFRMTTDIDLSEWINTQNAGEGWKPIGGASAFFGHFDGNGHTIDGLWTPQDCDRGGLFATLASGSTVSNLQVNVSSRGMNGGTCAGGIAGRNAGTITGCKVTGSITGGIYAGGIAGENSGNVTACRFVGDVASAGTNLQVGGIAGQNTGSVTECYTEGTVSSTSSNAHIGGVVGDNATGAQVQDNYSTMSVTASGTSAYGAGIVGYNSGEVARCYATGDVTGYSVAGVCGYNAGSQATLTGCVAANRQITAAQSGLRLLGGYSSGGKAPDMAANFALKSMAVSVNNIPQQIYDDPLNATARTQSELLQKPLYEGMGWDMETTWGIDEGVGFPYLRVFVVPVSGVTLNQHEAELVAGSTGQLTATVTPEDASFPAVTWSSSNPEVASVDASGLITAQKVGQATIIATSKDNALLADSCKVTVLPKKVTSIELNHETLTLECDSTSQLTANVQPTDATDCTVTWTSNREEVASVDENGMVTAHSIGTATITATAHDGSGIAAFCQVTVIPRRAASIAIDRDKLSLEQGKSESLVATVLPEDAGNRTVTWSSSDEYVATVTDGGIVTALHVGIAFIRATTNDGSNLTDSCEVTVYPKKVTSISMDKETLTLERGTTGQLNVTILPADAGNRTVTWASDREEVASVDENGVVTAHSVGTATITATTHDGTELSASCQVTVVPKKVTSIELNHETLTLECDATGQLIATAFPEDADDRSVTWASDREDIASVDENGMVTAHSVGTATITVTAHDGSGLSASCVVTVIPKKVTSISLNKDMLTLERESSEQLFATVLPEDAGDRTVTWASDWETVASVDENGVVTAHSEGTAVITATTNDGTDLSASCTVTVTPRYSGTCGDNVTWELTEDGVLIISGSGNMEDYTYPLPLAPWYPLREKIKSAVIEYGVTNISSYAFFECRTMTSISIPESVTEIGRSCFEWCGIESVIVPNSVTILNAQAFLNCWQLKSISLPKDINILDFYVFGGCRSLEAIIIPDKVTQITSCSFTNCSSLERVIIEGNDWPSLSADAFDADTKVTVFVSHEKAVPANWDKLGLVRLMPQPYSAPYTGDYPKFTFESSNTPYRAAADNAFLNVDAGTYELTELNVLVYKGGSVSSEFSMLCSFTPPYTYTIEKASQTIVWEQDFSLDLMVGEEIPLLAQTSSGLEVEYASSDEDVAVVYDGVLLCKSEGEAIITASYGGDQNHFAATSISKAIRITSANGLSNNLVVGLAICPNPATTYVDIQAEGGIKRVLLHSLAGMLLMDEDGQGEATYRLDLTQLPQGTYLLTVETPAGIRTERIVKE